TRTAVPPVLESWRWTVSPSVNRMELAGTSSLGGPGGVSVFPLAAHTAAAALISPAPHPSGQLRGVAVEVRICRASSKLRIVSPAAFHADCIMAGTPARW